MEEQNNNTDEFINKIDVNINPKERKMHDRICPCCKQPYKTKVGIDNWKNLFRKPTIDEWITLGILILLIAAAYAYTTETKTCRETLSNLSAICMQMNSNLTGDNIMNTPGYIPPILYNNTVNESTASEVNSSNDSDLQPIRKLPETVVNLTENVSNVSGA